MVSSMPHVKTKHVAPQEWKADPLLKTKAGGGSSALLVHAENASSLQVLVRLQFSTHATDRDLEDSETPEDVVCAPEHRRIMLDVGRHSSEAGETSPACAACKARSRDSRKSCEKITYQGYYVMGQHLRRT